MLSDLRRGTPSATPTVPIRRLFLDDDPDRAAEFLADYPDAVWVETVPACIERLGESWDEVYLDHDLNGEQYVDFARDDCGMAIIRWLEAEPRPHLRGAKFVVHSHNAVAAYLMALQLKSMGLRAEASPFGMGKWRPAPLPPPRRFHRLVARFFGPRKMAGAPVESPPPLGDGGPMGG